MFETLQSPYCCKALFLYGRVADLSGFELSTGVSDVVFFTILPHLAQHCSWPTSEASDYEWLVCLRDFKIGAVVRQWLSVSEMLLDIHPTR